MIVVLLVLVVIIFLAAGSFKKRSTPRKRLKYRSSTLLLSGYAAILLLAVLISFTLPDKQNANAESLSYAEVQAQRIKMERLLRSGKTSEVSNEYLKKQWEFPYDNKKITLHDPSDYGMLMIYLDKKSNSKKIKASYYQSPSRIEGRKIDELPIPEVEVAGTVINVNYTNPATQHYSLFQHEFPFQQFSGNENHVDVNSNSSFGSSIMYLEVPEEVKVDTNAAYIVEVH
ncbi:hypothetical protein Q7A53_08620 [Halobacillus rhizosphaerae]|uniref:hypothetical protein n=1 Tax=Halobacillus rhizosphaerae TaxID=3064889 RepID=UPI00398AEDBE